MSISWWCHPTVSSSVIPFSSCLQSFPASGSFLMSQLELQLQHQSFHCIFRVEYMITLSLSKVWLHSVQFSSVAESCPTLCDPMNRSTPGLPVHHQLPGFTQTHVHRVSDAIQPSHPLSSPSPPAPNPSQHQSFPMSQLFAWDGQSTGASTCQKKTTEGT